MQYNIIQTEEIINICSYLHHVEKSAHKSDSYFFFLSQTYIVDSISFVKIFSETYIYKRCGIIEGELFYVKVDVCINVYGQ